MKKKYLSIYELNNLMGSVPWQIKTWIKPPVKAINTPMSSPLTAGSGNLSLISCPSVSCAGLNVYRYDSMDAPNIWNVDHYDVFYTPTPKIYFVEGPKKQNNHHLKKNQRQYLIKYLMRLEQESTQFTAIRVEVIK